MTIAKTDQFRSLIDGALGAGRFDLAESLARSLLASRSEDAAALLAAANVYRAKGELETSRSLLLRIPPTSLEHSQAAAIMAICNQEPSAAPERVVAPVPFATTHDLLSPSELSTLREFAFANEPAFREARVKAVGRVDKLTRRARVWQGVPPLPVPLEAHVTNAIRRNARRLGMERELPEKYEVEISAYTDGDFIRPHWDRGDGVTRGRRLTNLFYFHAEPPGFKGGQLQLFDTGPDGDFDEAKWTGVAPTTNMLLQFRSEAIHAVSPVTGGMIFAACRFCLTFWAWE